MKEDLCGRLEESDCPFEQQFILLQQFLQVLMAHHI
jgi:hypothetical protein